MKRGERFVEIVLHQHDDSEADHVYVLRGDPFFDDGKEPFFVFWKNFWRRHVARSPIVNVRKKTIQLIDRLLKITELFDQKAVQTVFLVVIVWQVGHKVGTFFRLRKFTSQTAKRGRAYADDGIGIDGGKELFLKGFVVFVP